MSNILSTKRRIYLNQVKWNYLRNQKSFLNFFLYIQNLHKYLNILKKKKNSLIADVLRKL